MNAIQRRLISIFLVVADLFVEMARERVQQEGLRAQSLRN